MSRFVEAVWLALDAVWTHKLRSLLTVLGNIVAVASIIAVVTLIEGMNEAVSDAITSEAGADSFMIERVGIITDEDEAVRARRLNPLITIADAEAVRDLAPGIDAVMAKVERRGRVGYRGRELERAQIEGVSEDYIRFASYDAERGRLITPAEIRRRRPIVVIGWGIADRLFESADPIGQTITIEGRHFHVVGVSEKRGTTFGQSQDEFALIPLGAHQKIFGIRRSLSLRVRPADQGDMDRAMDDAAVALRVHRKLPPSDEDNFGAFTSGTILGIWEQATAGIFAVLIGVVGLALVVGGIVIMNIMLMVVTERTREIGLRKAVGARRRDIVAQILSESVVLSIVGGVVGILLGFAIALTIEQMTPVPASVEAWSVVVGISMTAVVGVFFGLFPAMRAARLSPIEALRKE